VCNRYQNIAIISEITNMKKAGYRGGGGGGGGEREREGEGEREVLLTIKT
jgi:hypothetical protein